MPYPTQATASHFIGGQYVEDSGGAPIDVISPATGKGIGSVHSVTPAIVAQAAWAAMTSAERGRILRRAADILCERYSDLSVLETDDAGNPCRETTVANATSGANALEYFGGLAATLPGEHFQSGEDWLYTRRETLCVCVGIGASNDPTQIACRKAASALACGHTMVFIPSKTPPPCGLKMAEILNEAGLPAGVYTVVQGLGDMGAALISHADVDVVSLTGSVPTGRTVCAAAAAGEKHGSMKLEGKSALIIFDDADVENALSGVILGSFCSSGQVFTNGAWVYVRKAIKDGFLNRLTECLAGAVIGDTMDPATSFDPMGSKRQIDIIQSCIAKGEAEGARQIYGGRRVDRPGLYLQPTVFTRVTDDMIIAREEIFGPVMAVPDFEGRAGFETVPVQTFFCGADAPDT